MLNDFHSDIEEYEKLIKEHGIDVAIAMVDESCVEYSENFIESHVTDPIFSSPYLTLAKNTMDAKLFELAEHGSEEV